MVRQTIILIKRAIRKTVNLLNSKSFISKWERISRKKLPINMEVQRQRKIGPRKNNRMIYLDLAAPAFKKMKAKRRVDAKLAQLGKGLGSNLVKAGFDLGAKALSSEFGKKLINKGIDKIPSIFKFGVSKIKNKNVQKALSSDIADVVIDEVQNRVQNKYASLFD